MTKKRGVGASKLCPLTPAPAGQGFPSDSLGSGGPVPHPRAGPANARSPGPRLSPTVELGRLGAADDVPLLPAARALQPHQDVLERALGVDLHVPQRRHGGAASLGVGGGGEMGPRHRRPARRAGKRRSRPGAGQPLSPP